MIIHIGNNNYIFEKDIIAILDKKSADATVRTRDFINNLIVENRMVGNLDQNTRTYVITSDNNKSMLYTSNISSKALLRRNNINIKY